MMSHCRVAPAFARRSIATSFADEAVHVFVRALPVLILISVALGAHKASLAQPRSAHPTGPSAFARYVPASARLFVTVRRLGETDEALHRAHAWRLAPLLSGSPPSDEKTFDLRSAVTSFLGLGSAVDIDELAQIEMGLAARSWSEVGTPVWFVRLRDRTVLDRWFPPGLRTAESANGAARLFRTPDGVMVCVRGGIAAMARHWGPDSLLQEVMHLMAGRQGEALQFSTTFRELVAYLPVNYLATAYVARVDGPAEGKIASSSWLPIVDRAMVGLYEGEGRIDVAVRASLAAPYRRSKLSPAAIDRLMRLPQTTLFASGTTVDFDRPNDARAPTSLIGALERYVVFLTGVRGTRGEEGERTSLFGPHVLFAWDQDFSEGGSRPQPAVMIECTDGRAAHDHVRQIVERIIRLVRTIDGRETAGPLAIEQSVHLGVPTLRVPLKAYAEQSRLEIIRLLRNTEPSWTVWNGWLIFTMSRDHLDRILDAQYGLVPPLAAVPDVQVLRRRPAERVVLSVVQPGLATDVLDGWLSAYRAGAPSLLDPIWWQGRGGSTSHRQPQVGIGMSLAQEPGVVIVSRVYPQTPAEGRLEPGDAILGIDGHLLSLNSPNTDLRKRWAESTAEPGPTLRVQRNGKALDVVLPRVKTEAASSKVPLEPADAVRELASLWRSLDFASFEVLVSDETHYSARLSLRLAPTRTTDSPPGP